jgi:hypothetical protein
MPATHIPKYPVVDPDPSTSRALSNLYWKDYVQIATFSVAGFALGWFGGNFRFFLSNLLSYNLHFYVY